MTRLPTATVRRRGARALVTGEEMVAMTAFSSIEDVERLEPKASAWVPPYAGTYQLLCQAATRHPSAMLTFARSVHADAGSSTTTSWTYPELVRRVTQAGNLFRRLGVGRNDVVSLLVEEHDAMQAALWGAQMVGIAHPVDTALAARAAAGCITAARPTLLVVSASLASEELMATLHARVPTLRACLLVSETETGATPRGASFLELLDREPILPQESIESPQPGDVCALLQTAGSCGSPKLARLTHGNLVYAATVLSETVPLDKSSVMLCGTPASHVSGLVVNGILPLQVGASLVLLGDGGFRAPDVRRQVWKLADRHEATTLFATPAVLTQLADVAVAGADLRHLRHVFCGGAGVAASLVHRIETMTGARVVVGYGLTEATCVSTVVPSEATTTPRSVGLPLAFQALRCARRHPGTGHWVEVPPGATGRVQVSGPNVFAGYVGTSTNAPATLTDGWLDTGDLGFLDGDGHLQLVGRDRDVILRGGRKLPCGRIENALGGHPDVAAVAVVPRPDPVEGEVPVAYVALHLGAATRPEVLLSHCRLALRDAQCLPADIRVLRELPCTLPGKVDRIELRRMEAARAIREFLRAAGIAVNVQPEATDPDAVRLVIDQIPRGRRPTVVRVMERFALHWCHAGESAQSLAGRRRPSDLNLGGFNSS